MCPRAQQAAGGVPVKPRSRLSPLPLLLVAAALAAWAVPGSAAVRALPAQHLAAPVAVQATPPPAATCDPPASLRPAGPPTAAPAPVLANVPAPPGPLSG